MKPSRRPLPRSFFARPALAVAPDLLGRLLVRTLPGGTRLAVRIVETEAYAERDPASHSFRGRTRRNEVMFGRPGRLYVYFTYGMHFCSNVVTGGDGEGSAVLLRAAEPLEGLEEMAESRGLADPLLLCSGPARLTQALGIASEENGEDLVRGATVRILEGSPARRIGRSTRVGVGAGAEHLWRFFVQDDPFVSKGRPAKG